MRLHQFSRWFCQLAADLGKRFLAILLGLLMLSAFPIAAAENSRLEKVLLKKPFIKEIFPVETNIVIAECLPDFNINDFILKMKEMGILFFAISPNRFRMVTHLDISNQMQEKLLETIHNIN